MTGFPFTDDVVLLNAGETARKGMYVEFGLFQHPDGPINPEARNPFLDLKQGREHGQRFRLTFHLLGENEECTDSGVAQTVEPRTLDAEVAGSTPAATASAAAPPDTPAAPEAPETPIQAEPAPAATKERRKLFDMPLSQRAGMMVTDRSFCWWFIKRMGISPIEPASDEADDWAKRVAEDELKRQCGVERKRDLKTASLACQEVFLNIEQAWLDSRTGVGADQETQRGSGP